MNRAKHIAAELKTSLKQEKIIENAHFLLGFKKIVDAAFVHNITL